MRATLDIDERLIEEAKRITGVKTKKDLINLSLRELIRKKRIEHLISLYGSSPVDLTVRDIEKFREDES